MYVEDVPEGVTRQEYFDASVDNLSEALGRRVDRADDRPAPGRRGAATRRPSSRRPRDGRSRQLAYIVFEEGTGYVITYSTLPQFAAEYADTFESSAETFRLLSGR